VIEQSHQGQLHRLIRMWIDVPREFNVLAKSGANPISPDDVLAQIRLMAQTDAIDPRPGANYTGLERGAALASLGRPMD
jgi:2-oxoglutarate ferredoxin oxidoreductase subunit alpha